MYRLFVVAFAYLMVWGVESTSYPAPIYYMMLSVVSGITVYFSCLKQDKLLIIYGFLNLLCVWFYIFAIFPTNDWVYGVLYYTPLNYSIVVRAFELFIICVSIANAVTVFYNWICNFNFFRSNADTGNFEAKTST